MKSCKFFILAAIIIFGSFLKGAEERKNPYKIQIDACIQLFEETSSDITTSPHFQTILDFCLQNKETTKSDYAILKRLCFVQRNSPDKQDKENFFKKIAAEIVKKRYAIVQEQNTDIASVAYALKETQKIHVAKIVAHFTPILSVNIFPYQEQKIIEQQLEKFTQLLQAKEDNDIKQPVTINNHIKDTIKNKIKNDMQQRTKKLEISQVNVQVNRFSTQIKTLYKNYKQRQKSWFSLSAWQDYALPQYHESFFKHSKDPFFAIAKQIDDLALSDKEFFYRKLWAKTPCLKTICTLLAQQQNNSNDTPAFITWGMEKAQKSLLEIKDFRKIDGEQKEIISDLVKIEIGPHANRPSFSINGAHAFDGFIKEVGSIDKKVALICSLRKTLSDERPQHPIPEDGSYILLIKESDTNTNIDTYVPLKLPDNCTYLFVPGTDTIIEWNKKNNSLVTQHINFCDTTLMLEPLAIYPVEKKIYKIKWDTPQKNKKPCLTIQYEDDTVQQVNKNFKNLGWKPNKPRSNVLITKEDNHSWTVSKNNNILCTVDVSDNAQNITLQIQNPSKNTKQFEIPGNKILSIGYYKKALFFLKHVPNTYFFGRFLNDINRHSANEKAGLYIYRQPLQGTLSSYKITFHHTGDTIYNFIPGSHALKMIVANKKNSALDIWKLSFNESQSHFIDNYAHYTKINSCILQNPPESIAITPNNKIEITTQNKTKIYRDFNLNITKN